MHECTIQLISKMNIMKKVLLSLLALFTLALGVYAQSIDNSFFEEVSYVGAFDGTNDWTEGWTEWNPVDAEYPAATVTKGNAQFSRSTGLHITADETWSGVIKLDGWVYVDAGATLTINEGTIIRGTAKSGLFIERGGKIKAIGSKTAPIVFTSNQAAGLRAQSNWAGVVICGNAPINTPSGTSQAEGGIESEYGGDNPADDSGILKYVRIEFPGFEVSTGSEINGLTLAGVGSGTTLEYIQVSYSGDDGYEWFGGTVNAKHLISYKTEDDDFDTDYGFSGMVQFGLISRDPDIFDSDTGNAFESDNDANGSANEPLTKGVFSNVSAFGPFANKSLTLNEKHEDGSTMRIRRSSRLSIYNSLFLGWGNGPRLESKNTMDAAEAGTLNIKNCIIAGDKNTNYRGSNDGFDAAGLETWYLTAEFRNSMLSANEDAKIVNPFNYNTFNFQPMEDSPVLEASFWTTTPAVDYKDVNSTRVKNYPNPFSGKTNIELQLKKNAYVQIEVVNISGSVVTVLQSGDLYEGTHKFVFDASGLPTGLYFGKVKIGNDAQTLKMITK